MQGGFPDIQVLSIEELTLHETEDAARTTRLKERIRADGFLKNPVIVGRTTGAKPKHLLLDGVHRISALKGLGCRDVVAQVVDYSDESVKVETWRQLICGIKQVALLREIERVVGGRLKKESEDETTRLRHKRPVLVHLLLRNGDLYVVRDHASLEERVEKTQRILGTCASLAEIHRASEKEAETLLKKTRDAAGMLFIPKLEKADVLKIASSATKLPAGITRHIIPYRALGLFVDLALLRVRLPIGEKSKLIQAVVNQRVDDERVRFYEEPVFVFSE
jgi:hypothetical protein